MSEVHCAPILFSVAAVVLPLLLAFPAVPQTTVGAAQDSPQAFTAAYNSAMQAHDWDAATAAAQRLVQLSASSQNLIFLADAQLYAASAQHDSAATEQVLATCDRALAAVEKEKPAEGEPDAAWKNEKSKIYLIRGNVYLKLRRTAEAIEAYNSAAELALNPSLAYFNLCATSYNMGDLQYGLTACRKVVQADPARADGWFLVASILFAGAKIDAQGKFAMTAECRQALEKYLELAPSGPHAADVKAMLEMAAK